MIDYQQKIPNNVNLNTDKSLQELWNTAAKFLDWWGDLGPVASQVKDVYLRTAVKVLMPKVGQITVMLIC